jgi:radical SAM protein with 4Fe4S-binding SPASM domain
MISVSKLYTDRSQAHDGLRYGVHSAEGVENPHQVQKTAERRKPVVVWNITRTCNLRCVHCYTASEEKKYDGELNLEELLAVADDLVQYQVPAVLLSGGEPLIHPHFWDIAARLREGGLRVVISTNATLIKPETAKRLKELGLIYVGASLDGIGETNNKFRGKPWAFEKAVAGIRNAKAAGLKVSLRMTLTKHNVQDLEGIFRFVDEEAIERVCFYHLAYAGRAEAGSEDDCSPEESRAAVETIMRWTKKLEEQGTPRDIMTVDNHADGVFIYLKLLEEGQTERAEEVRKLLEWNGGGANSSGVGVSDIDFKGGVHADQFSMYESFGNVKDRPFSEIWEDENNEVLAGLRNRLPLLKGRCGACKYQKMCGGSLRVRAHQYYGDRWAEDPACYLSDEEIGYNPGPEEVRPVPVERNAAGEMAV